MCCSNHFTNPPGTLGVSPTKLLNLTSPHSLLFNHKKILSWETSSLYTSGMGSHDLENDEQ